MSKNFAEKIRLRQWDNGDTVESIFDDETKIYNDTFKAWSKKKNYQYSGIGSVFNRANDVTTLRVNWRRANVFRIPAFLANEVRATK